MKRLSVLYYDTSNVTIDELLKSPYLSNKDKLSFEKYKIEETKKEKIVSTIFKNKYVGEYEINEHGKPISENKFFNVSHSHGYVVFALDNAPIGIDIEQIRSINQNLIDFVSNDEEKKYIHDDTSFFEIWTNKEALVKALGTGIKIRPNQIPALPLNSQRLYEGKTYFNKTIIFNGHVISVSSNSDVPFEIEMVQEKLD